ncbi:MAG: DUF1684 domain-containing protein [Ilumatobacteraceae bacterium]
MRHEPSPPDRRHRGDRHDPDRHAHHRDGHRRVRRRVTRRASPAPGRDREPARLPGDHLDQPAERRVAAAPGCTRRVAHRRHRRPRRARRRRGDRRRRHAGAQRLRLRRHPRARQHHRRLGRRGDRGRQARRVRHRPAAPSGRADRVGRPQSLVVFADKPEYGLFALFTDATSGVTTYGLCRSLSIPAPAADGSVRVGLNRATTRPARPPPRHLPAAAEGAPPARGHRGRRATPPTNTGADRRHR